MTGWGDLDNDLTDPRGAAALARHWPHEPSANGSTPGAMLPADSEGCILAGGVRSGSAIHVASRAMPVFRVWQDGTGPRPGVSRRMLLGQMLGHLKMVGSIVTPYQCSMRLGCRRLVRSAQDPVPGRNMPQGAASVCDAGHRLTEFMRAAYANVAGTLRSAVD
jgi:hypothetical protein